MFLKKESDGNEAQMAVPGIFKVSYKLGFEVGYFKHNESYGWVCKKREEIIYAAKNGGFLDKAAFYYKKGKIDGATKAVRDRNSSEKEKAEHYRIYENILDRAWDDGQMDKDEEAMLKVLNAELGIDKKSFVELSVNKKLNTYKKVLEQAWDDGVITPEEQAILDDLAENLGITPLQHTAITKELKDSGMNMCLKGYKCAGCEKVFRASPLKSVVQCEFCGKLVKVRQAPCNKE